MYPVSSPGGSSDRSEHEGRYAKPMFNYLIHFIKILEVIETSDMSRGRLLYEQIINNNPILTWTSKDEKIFISYVELIYPELIDSIKRIQRRNKLTNHRMLYLLLKGLKKTDEEVCTIMMLSPEGLRSMRNRTKSV